LQKKLGEDLKHIYVYPISGLYSELYNPNPDEIRNELKIVGNSIKPNGLFWYKIFNEKSLLTLIEQLEIYVKTKNQISPQFMAVLSNKQKFINNVKNH